MILHVTEQYSFGAVHPSPACLRGVAWWWPPCLHDEGSAVVQVGKASSGFRGPGVSASYGLCLQMATDGDKWLQMAIVSKKIRGLLGWLEVRIAKELHAGHCGWPM